MALVTFRDETATDREPEEFTRPDLPEPISAREPVRLRVREETARCTAAPSPHFRGPVTPADAGAELTGDSVASVVSLMALAGG
ncbi:hypothetical protein ACFV0L_20175 [Streptosporangium canum]|uniref:hypothetical protein n=1 Tax=Streptosporangium canum TaxID=324952 RepID=UPI0036CD0428